ncbi:MAG: NYN domain-containing protein [Armatimonadetes bacterium]|nr:NYN domain-containing protein [Armatimonadota bacterium]MDW8120902.1 NYN domain-containing protein [Armatimonadota bacterium]
MSEEMLPSGFNEAIRSEDQESLTELSESSAELTEGPKGSVASLERAGRSSRPMVTDFIRRPREPTWRVGVFLDIQNIYMCVRSVFKTTKINYKVLKDFLESDGVQLKCVAFSCYDPHNQGQQDFLNALALMGYRVVAKTIKKMADGNVKATTDLEMALEILATAPYLDEVVLVTGDGDFAPVLEFLSRMGIVTKVIGPDRLTSPDLIRACDQFINLSQIEGIFKPD